MKRHLHENMLPVAVIVMFFIATIFSTRQLLNHTTMLHERYFKNRTAAEDMGRAFNDFEAVFLSYLAGDTHHDVSMIDAKIAHFEKMYKRFYMTIQGDHLDSKFMVHTRNLENDLVVLKNLFTTTKINSSVQINDVAINALYQMHTTLSGLGYDLILDHNSAFNGDEMNRHRWALYL